LTNSLILAKDLSRHHLTHPQYLIAIQHCERGKRPEGQVPFKSRTMTRDAKDSPAASSTEHMGQLHGVSVLALKYRSTAYPCPPRESIRTDKTSVDCCCAESEWCKTWSWSSAWCGVDPGSGRVEGCVACFRRGNKAFLSGAKCASILAEFQVCGKPQGSEMHCRTSDQSKVFLFGGAGDRTQGLTHTNTHTHQASFLR
jgi:hypothetical protein